jgi:signal transduction histidine kinase
VVGTNAGIFFLKGERFEPLQTDQGKITETVFRTYEDKDGYLWAGTNIGLMVIKDNKIHSYLSENKLLADVIFQVMEDHLGVMWLTSTVGVIRISRQELIARISSHEAPLHAQLFNKSNGLPVNGITGASKGMIALDKKIWFPTLQGVAIVDPANIVSNKVPPPIVVEKILVDGVDFEPGKMINVKPLSRNIEIHYTAMSFIAPDKVQFRYLLKGYDKEWHEASDRRAAYFNSLPPGDYTFMLEAKNNDDVWSKEESAVVLHVAKAFWQTWTFYILTALLVGLIIYALVNYRIRSIKELNQKLDERIQERTQEVLAQKEEIEAQRDFIEERNIELEKAKNTIDEQYAKLQVVNESLEEKVAERTRALLQALEELDYFVYKSSHDIKGPLARLHGLSNLALMESKEEVTRRYLQLLQRESILANRVIQKLSYANQIKNMTIETEAINLREMLQQVINQLKGMHTEAEEMVFIIDVDDRTVFNSDAKLVKELFASVIENSIVFRGEKNQLVRLASAVHEEEISITIFDNGVGIDEKVKPGLFKMFYKGSEKSVGLGLGLYIARRITEKLSGKIILKNSLKGQTEFEIMLPLVLKAQNEANVLIEV